MKAETVVLKAPTGELDHIAKGLYDAELGLAYFGMSHIVVDDIARTRRERSQLMFSLKDDYVISGDGQIYVDQPMYYPCRPVCSTCWVAEGARRYVCWMGHPEEEEIRFI